MTIATILGILGIAQEVVTAIGDLIDIDQEVTPEMLADIKAKMAAAEEGWANS